MNNASEMQGILEWVKRHMALQQCDVVHCHNMVQVKKAKCNVDGREITVFGSGDGLTFQPNAPSTDNHEIRCVAHIGEYLKKKIIPVSDGVLEMLGEDQHHAPKEVHEYKDAVEIFAAWHAAFADQVLYKYRVTDPFRSIQDLPGIQHAISTAEKV